MNVFFLTEDSKSFQKVLPIWLKFMEFPCERVNSLRDASGNSYVLESGYGIQQLIDKTLEETLNEIDASVNKIDWLVIIVDSESKTIYEREKEVNDVIKNHYRNTTPYYNIKIIVCHCCFETWLLGDEKIFPDSFDDETHSFYNFIQHYNVKSKDPQLMQKPDNYEDPKAHYHFQYFSEMCRFNNLRYCKSRPEYAKYRRCFNALERRIQTTKHISTFKEFYDFIKSLT